MKSRILKCITAITLFAALATPVRPTAQEQPAVQGEKAQDTRYRVIDIGTFGGPASYINPVYSFGSANQINSQGITVGAAATSLPTTPTSSGIVCGGLDGTLPFVFHAFEWDKGVVTDLGALPGRDNCSVATAVNAGGEIVGTSENGLIDPVLGLNQVRAVLWKDGQIKDLGTFGGNVSVPGTLNNRGQVARLALTAVPDPFSIFYFLLGGGVSTGTETRAFLWQDGQMQDLGTLGGPDASASLLNERGQVGGASYTNSTPNATTGFPTLDPFLWENGKMTDLGTLGGTVGGPAALNNRGQVIGVSNLAGDKTSDQFLWDQGKLIDLTTQSIGGTFLAANAINDAGEIVGGAAFPGRIFDASLWRDGVLTDLGTLDGDCYSEAWAINSRGQVAGMSLSCDFSNLRAFLWQSGLMIDLNAQIPADSSLKLAWALAINDRGEIGGIGVPPGSPPDYQALGHAFVLVPAGQDTESTTAISQNSLSPVKQSPTTAMQGGPASREIMARIHARLARRSYIPARQLGQQISRGGNDASSRCGAGFLFKSAALFKSHSPDQETGLTN